MRDNTNNRRCGKILVLVSILAAASVLPCCGVNGDEVKLWPEIEPYRTGYLKVSELHEIYYEVCGKEGGIPVFVLHGGPGAGCYPYYRRFNDPDKFMIVLHDQRGCGRSKPFGEIRENTTWDLVEDIEKLRVELDAGKIILFGGSWGTTLGLAYAETYPQNVAGLVLRGVFLSTRYELQHYYYGGVARFFPDTYDRLAGKMEEAGKTVSPENLFHLIHEGTEDQKRKYSVAWCEYESKIATIEAVDEDYAERYDSSDFWRRLIYSLGLLENYYMMNNCFLEEGQLLDNADRIAGIPAIIVNGRFDMVCPPISAYRLHEKLPLSKLVIAGMAGHSMSQKPIERELLKAMNEFGR